MPSGPAVPSNSSSGRLVPLGQQVRVSWSIHPHSVHMVCSTTVPGPQFPVHCTCPYYLVHSFRSIVFGLQYAVHCTCPQYPVRSVQSVVSDPYFPVHITWSTVSGL